MHKPPHSHSRQIWFAFFNQISLLTTNNQLTQGVKSFTGHFYQGWVFTFALHGTGKSNFEVIGFVKTKRDIHPGSFNELS
ncbi:MAG: hypothetical protein ACD_34C00052G0002 [uncultured bacterium]|nr:MAG: hypothetical protein ACD_34C00052G0002 [uncultured bacterium]